VPDSAAAPTLLDRLLRPGRNDARAVRADLWWLIGLGNFSNYLTIGVGLIGIGLVFGFVVVLHYRFMPVGNLTDPNDIVLE